MQNNNHAIRSMKSNIVLNSLKTAMRFVFPLITFPYVSRILGSVSLGKVSFSNSIISYFALISALGVGTYSIREGAALREKPLERNIFFNEVFSVNFISMTCSYLILFAVTALSIKLKEYYLLLAIQSFTMLFSWIGVDWIFYIYEDYIQITLRSFIAQLVSLIMMFIFVKTPDDYIIYALIIMLSNCGSSLFNYIYVGKYYRPRITFRCNLKKHIKPLLILAVNDFTTTIYVNSDTTMIGFYLGDHYVGLYTTAAKVYFIVKNVMVAIITSGSSRASFYFHNNDLHRYHILLVKMAQVLLLVMIPATIGLLMTGRDVILAVAGLMYIESIPALSILSFALLASTFASFGAIYCLVVQRKERTLLLHTAVSAIINIILNILLIPTIGIIGAAITTLISELYVCIVFGIKTNLFGVLKECSGTIFSCVLSSAAIVLVCFLVSGVSDLFFRLFLSIGISCLAHALILIVRKEDLAIDLLKRKKIM